MSKEILTFGDIEIKKINFAAIKVQQYFSKDEDIEKVLASSIISFGEKSYKYFIGCLYNNNNNKVKPLQIMLPKTSP